MITGQSELQRQRYWQGQRLRSRDLNDQLAAEAELSWWHNRAVHEPYGVVEGLGLVAGPSPPPHGPPVLGLTAGLAYDAFGRALELAVGVNLRSPPAEPAAPEGWILLLRRRTREGPTEGCAAASAQAPSGEVELVWKPAPAVRFTDGVAVGRVKLRQLLQGDFFLWDFTFRRHLARPLARPVIGHGATLAGKTAWRQRQFPSSTALPLQGIEVTLDTSAFGFTEVPCYFAWLVGGPLSIPSHGWATGPTPPVSAPLWLLDRLTDEGTDRFTFSLWAPGLSPNLGPTLLDLARRQLSVAWLGVERTTTATMVGVILL